VRGGGGGGDNQLKLVKHKGLVRFGHWSVIFVTILRNENANTPILKIGCNMIEEILRTHRLLNEAGN